MRPRLLTPDAVPARSDPAEVRTRVVNGAIARLTPSDSRMGGKMSAQYVAFEPTRSVMAHPKPTRAPSANNGKRRPNRRQSMSASGETTVIRTCRGMKAKPANSVGRCAPRIITKGIKVSMTVNAP